MRRFVVIGLGKFGSQVARTLFARGHEVVGIDSDPQRVQDLRDHLTRPVTTDSTEPENLRALDLAGADAAVVSLGERMDASILVTLYLKELGLQKIVVKAVSEDHGKILSLIGATAVVRQARLHPAKYPWIAKLLAKKPAKLVAIAVANKTARIAWAIMSKGGTYRPPALAAAA